MNGNWTDAARGCVEFGFYAADMIKAFALDECPIISEMDIVLLAEMAQKIRDKN